MKTDPISKDLVYISWNKYMKYDILNSIIIAFINFCVEWKWTPYMNKKTDLRKNSLSQPSNI